MPSTLDRLIYVDDSGHPQTGTVVFGWIEFSPDRWNSILGTWLDTRRRLWRDFGVPVTEVSTTAESEAIVTAGNEAAVVVGV